MQEGSHEKGPPKLSHIRLCPMMSASLVTLLLGALAVSAQYGAPPDNSPTSSAAAPASVPSAPADTNTTFNIDVGFQNTFTFHPNNITAPSGSSVTFWFPNNGIFNHSVTQSTMEDPCTLMKATDNTTSGFDTGLVGGVQFTINITDDTQPIYFHCKQLLHCGMGMVGSINAPTSGNGTIEAFMAAAMAIGSKEVTESDTGFVSATGPGLVATAAPAATGTSAPQGSAATRAEVERMTLVIIAPLVAIALALAT